MQTTKSIVRRLHDPGFTTKYFSGVGIDIGSGPDPLANYKAFFPKVTCILSWDQEQGDSTHMAGVPDNTYDFVHSSHCLEHLNDPGLGLSNWWRILKPGGYLILLVPDEDLYEQRVWPSTFNHDHKVTFTIWKGPGVSWSPVSRNLIDDLNRLPGAQLHRIQLLDQTYNYSLPRFDQTRTFLTESGIEAVVRKS